MTAAEQAGFEVRDVENLGEHYAMTLRHWLRGLEACREVLLSHVSEPTYRIWLLYMAGCAAAFQRGDIGLYQTLLSAPSVGGAACRSPGATGMTNVRRKPEAQALRRKC